MAGTSTIIPTTIGGAWSIKQVAGYLGVSRRTIDRWVESQADFPKPLQLSNQTQRWDSKEVEEWFFSQSRKK